MPRIFKYTLHTLKVSFIRVKTRLKIAFISVVKKKKKIITDMKNCTQNNIYLVKRYLSWTQLLSLTRTFFINNINIFRLKTWAQISFKAQFKIRS